MDVKKQEHLKYIPEKELKAFDDTKSVVKGLADTGKLHISEILLGHQVSFLNIDLFRN